jgi:hypothetical protein
MPERQAATDMTNKTPFVTCLQPIWVGGLLSLALALPVGARPTATQDTGTAEFKHWESEIGFEYEKATDGREFVIAPTFTYGLTPHMETEIAWDYALESPDGEPASRQLLTAFEFKERFWEPAGENGPSAGVKGKFAVPTNVSGPEGSTDPEGYLKFIYARPSGAVEMDYNLGYKYRGAWSADGNDKFFAGVCVRYRTTPRWQWLGEVYAEIPERHARETTGVVAAGFKYKVRDGLKADLLVGTGLGHDAPILQVTCGLVWEL